MTNQAIDLIKGKLEIVRGLRVSNCTVKELY